MICVFYHRYSRLTPHANLQPETQPVEVLLHENLGGAFSPQAAHKIRRNGRKTRKARNHGIDRTPYKAT